MEGLSSLSARVKVMPLSESKEKRSGNDVIVQSRGFREKSYETSVPKASLGEQLEEVRGLQVSALAAANTAKVVARDRTEIIKANVEVNG